MLHQYPVFLLALRPILQLKCAQGSPLLARCESKGIAPYSFDLESVLAGIDEGKRWHNLHIHRGVKCA